MIPDLTWTQLAFLVIGLVGGIVVLVILLQLVIVVIASRRMRQMDREFSDTRDRMLGRRR